MSDYIYNLYVNGKLVESTNSLEQAKAVSSKYAGGDLRIEGIGGPIGSNIVKNYVFDRIEKSWVAENH